MADETKTNATPGGPPPPAPEQTEQAVIPGMDSGPAPSGKVIDLSDVRPALLDGRRRYCSEACARAALREQKRDYMRKRRGW